MRYLSIVFLFVCPSFVLAGEPLTPRPVDPLAAETLAHALARSAAVRSLVATLEASNVVVHIESSRELPSGIGGTTRFVTSRGGLRYLRITIAVDLPPVARAAILGHELQHACEVAQSSAEDLPAIERLFEREGHRTGGYFETRAAIETERIVRMELRERTAARALRLRSGSALQAEPVVKFHH